MKPWALHRKALNRKAQIQMPKSLKNQTLPKPESQTLHHTFILRPADRQAFLPANTTSVGN